MAANSLAKYMISDSAKIDLLALVGETANTGAGLPVGEHGQRQVLTVDDVYEAAWRYDRAPGLLMEIEMAEFARDGFSPEECIHNLREAIQVALAELQPWATV